jgi:hypothetical protein
MSSFPAISPYVKFYFNQPLSTKDLSVTSQPEAFGNPKLQGKTLTLSVTTPLDTSQSYTVTIHSIRSTSGKQLTDQVFRFTPQDIPFQKLSKAMQQAILAIQANKPLTRDSFTYIGDTAFTDRGLTIIQLAGVKQALFQYLQIQHLKANTITFSEVTIIPFDPHQNTGITTGTFTVSFDGSHVLNGSLSYSDLTHIQVVLRNPQTNAVVYDSGSITPA